jgi:hypothetical protein
MTYNERVQAIAEEMAKEEWLLLPGNKNFKFEDLEQYAKDPWIEDNIKNARIAVKHIAEAVKEAYVDVAWWELTPYLFNEGFISEDNEDWKEFNSMPRKINYCEACHINKQILEGEIAGVKQMPCHTCGIDGPDKSSSLNEKIDFNISKLKKKKS